MADEKFFYLTPKGTRYSKRLHPHGVATMAINPGKHHDSRRVTVWAALGLEGYTQIYILKSGKYLTGKDYQEILSNGALRDMAVFSPQVELAEDNVSIHKTEEVQEVYAKAGVKHTFLFPYCPDLDWMEKAWANLGDRVYEQGRIVFKNKEDLIKAIQAAWLAMAGDWGYRRKLFASFQGACKAIMDNQGYMVHW
jgi:transposase